MIFIERKNKFMKNPKTFILIFLVTSFVVITFILNHLGILKIYMYNDEELTITTNQLIPYITKISSHPDNLFYYKTKVIYPDGTPARFRRVEIKIDGQAKAISKNSFTNKQGEILFYIKPKIAEDKPLLEEKTVKVYSGLKQSDIKTLNTIKLTPIPVLFVHGYRDFDYSFNNLKNFLTEKGFTCFKYQYDSTKGIKSSANDLSNILDKKRREMFEEQILVNKFNLVAHSYGGLVARFYTSTKQYKLKRNDVSKIIFLATPHQGTPLATIGKSIYDDETIRDLSTDSTLFVDKFPNMINRGLNNQLQIGNIIVQYDELVSPESSKLDRWQIPTKMYNVGEDKRILQNIIQPDFHEKANHHLILNNKKIFEEIYKMLTSKLPHPQILR